MHVFEIIWIRVDFGSDQSGITVLILFYNLGF